MAKQSKQGDKCKAIGYVRASKGSQEVTPAAQRDALEAWAKEEGIELVAVHEDTVSGAAPLDKRPGMLAALAALAEHGAGWLAVAKRDRLTRDVIAGAMIERMAERNGAEVVAANGAGNGDGPEAQLMRRMIDAFAEYERAMIRARTCVALAAKKARGERTGEIPYGYSLSEDGVHLEACEDELDAILLVWELRAGGLTLKAIGEELKARGICNRAGHMNWNPKSVRALVKARMACASR